MIRAGLSTLLAHWRRHPLQLATLIAGLALATALWTGVQAINAEAKASYERAARQVAPAEGVVTGPGGSVTVEDYARLRRAGWSVVPVMEGRLDIPGGRITVVGTDFVALPPEGGGPEEDADPAALLHDPGVGLADAATAEAVRGLPGMPDTRVSDRPAPGTLLTDIAVAARLLSRENPTHLLLTEPAPGPLNEIAPGLTLSRAGDPGAGRLTDSFHLNLTAFGLLAFAVGMFIAHGAVGLVFEQRRPMFRTLRALGLPLRALVGTALAELLILALAAGIIGVALGYAVAAALLPDVAATLRGLYGANVGDGLRIRPEWWLSGLGMALAGTLAAAAAALWRIARMPILDAGRPRAWAIASARGSRRQAAAAALLLAAAGALATAAPGLPAAFGLLATLLFGSALILPPILAAALRMAERTARSPLAQWFWADTRQQLSGLSLALMSLLLALAANIGVDTMVASFRLTFTAYLDQRLAAELYVRAETDSRADELRDWLAPRVDAVLPVWTSEGMIGGERTRVVGIEPHATHRENWPMIDSLPSPWERVARGGALLLNEQGARRLGVSPGDRVALAPAGDLLLAGVYADYGNPAAEAVVSADLLVSAFEGADRREFGVRVPPGAVPALMDALRDEFGLSGDAMIDQATLKEISLGIFERTFTVTGALSILALIVSGVAILTSLLTLGAMRLPQLAPVWAMGVRRSRLARLDFLRAAALAAMTFAVALPVGLALAWALLARLNVAAFGWRLPMFLFPSDWLTLFALAMAAALIAAAWPVRALARTTPAEFLKVFAGER